MSEGAARPVVRLTDAQRLEWLRLIRSEGVGPRTFRKLVNHFGSAAEALRELPGLARQRHVPVPRITTMAEAEREMELAARLGVVFVATGEPDYPVPLAAIADAPPILGLRGDARCLSAPAVAIVGSRNASAAGQQFARSLAAGLGRAGFTIVSGLARGIDARAHEASLATGTVAVLAGGHEHPYPPEHAALLEQVLETGVALSEMPTGWEPRGRDFPRRNRLVSGLGLGTVLIEAARKSGSLITARFALEQGREVMAVPGSPLDPRAQGTNDLIRQGATLVTGLEDVLEVLEPLLRKPFDGQHLAREQESPEPDEPLFDEIDYLAEPGAGRPLVLQDEPARREPVRQERVHAVDPAITIAGLLGPSPVSVDDLIRMSSLHPGTVHLALYELESRGLLDRHAGTKVSLRPTSA
ncbi:DNA-processing protein DprA [uncultured Alsobacter sp.]|uniref:DNA-processing protein DprA n=1 Tax=uncultured Alsobacter sp. TaxID=1748258 RepID=UPI0025F33BCC|nr:DNA-processing protein DprA [uncultured Alsobacter sp.]